MIGDTGGSVDFLKALQLKRSRRNNAYIMDTVLVLGNHQQTITVIRSLGRAGYRVIVGCDADARVFTQFSRHTAEIWRHPPASEGESVFADALQRLLSQGRIHCVFPVGELHLLWVTRNLERCPSGVAVVTPGLDNLEACLDKSTAHRIAVEAGVPVPQQIVSFDLVELREGAEALGFPCIVKPESSFQPFFGEKAIILRDRDSLARHFASWPDGNEMLIVQRYVSGIRHNCDLISVNGELLAYFELKALRTDRFNGTGLYVDGISVAPDPHTRDHCARLLRQMRYTGPSMVQFLVNDEDESKTFLEINPRLDAFCAVGFHCGYDFPRWAVECVRSTDPVSDKYPTSYPTQVRVIWFMGDLRGIWRAASEHKLPLSDIGKWFVRMLASFLRARRHITWSWRDPLPTLYLAGEFGWERARGLLRKLAVPLRR